MSTYPSYTVAHVGRFELAIGARAIAYAALLLVLLTALGSRAVARSAADGVGTTTTPHVSAGHPTEVTRGAGFTHDGYRVAPGWRIGRDGPTDSVNLTHVQVTNLATGGAAGAGHERDALLSFSFYRGTTGIAQVICNGTQLRPVQSATMSCSSTDPFPSSYDAIKVADTF